MDRPERPSLAHLRVGSVDVYVKRDAVEIAEAAAFDLEGSIVDTLDGVGRLLVVPPTEVHVEEAPQYAVDELGIGGFTDPASGRVYISLDGDHPALAESLKDVFHLLLAHEMHHSLRVIEGPGYGRTVAEEVVTEGLADHFVTEVFPMSEPLPVTDALSPDEMSLVRRAFIREQDRVLGLRGHRRWFFGTGNLPDYAGYSLGYDLVGDYLLKAGTTAAASARTSAAVILSKSGSGS